MKQWDIILYPFSEAGPHPAVVMSADERCANSSVKNINALICKSARPAHPTEKTEVVLDASDGLDWATVVRCDAMHFLPRVKFGQHLGNVSIQRRRAIARKLIECFRLREF